MVRQLVVLTLQACVVCTLFTFGLKATVDDLLYPWRRPGLLARSLVAIFAIMPVVAVLLARLFDFQPTAKIALIALAVAPIPPLLPRTESKAGGHAAFGLGLMVSAGVLSIVLTPATLELINLIFGSAFALAPTAVADVVFKFIVMPLAAGVGTHALAPRAAERIAPGAGRLANALLGVGLLALFVVMAPEIGAALGNGAVLVMLVFSAVGLAAGHFLGGPDPEHSLVLALSTSSRHPAIAFVIASTNFPYQRFGGTILLYILVNTVLSMLYIVWRRQRASRRDAMSSRTAG